MQTQDLLISTPLTNHLRRLKTGLKGREAAGVESALLTISVSLNPSNLLQEVLLLSYMQNSVPAQAAQVLNYTVN